MTSTLKRGMGKLCSYLHSFLIICSLGYGEAIEMCKQLVEKRFGHAVKRKNQEVEFRDDDTIYRFLEDDTSNALNAGISSDCEPRAGKI